jgi:hypothetical protein
LLPGLFFISQGCTFAVPLCDAEQRVPEELASSLVLEWETEYAARSWVEYEVDGHAMTTTPGETWSHGHTHTLLSLPPVTTFEYRAFSETERLTRSCRGVAESGNPPGNIPRYAVTRSEGDQSSRYVLIVNASEDRGGVVVVNRKGELVWYRERPEHRVTSHADFDQESGELLLFHQDAHRVDPSLSQLERVGWDGVCQGRQELYGGHHAWVQHEDRSFAWLAVDIRERAHPETGELVEVVGDQLVLSHADGSEQVLFSTWDWLELEGHPLFDFPYYEGRYDWTHANGLSFSKERDSYLVSLGHLDLVLELDGQSGDILQTMGGEDAVYAEGSSVIDFPHSPKWTSEGHLLLTTTDGTTFAVEYAVDTESGELSEVWSHGRDEEVYSAALGEVQELPGGGRMISYGMGALVQELDASGRVIWELEGRAGMDRLTSIRILDDLWGLP